jgi:hypothetical protein
MEQIENRVSGIIHKVEEIDKNKNTQNMNEICKTSRMPSKNQAYESWV